MRVQKSFVPTAAIDNKKTTTTIQIGGWGDMMFFLSRAVW